MQTFIRKFSELQKLSNRARARLSERQVSLASLGPFCDALTVGARAHAVAVCLDSKQGCTPPTELLARHAGGTQRGPLLAHGIPLVRSARAAKRARTLSRAGTLTGAPRQR